MSQRTDIELPAIRAAFDTLKVNLAEGMLPLAAQRLFGRSLLWGDELKRIYAREGREGLEKQDALTRFFVLRLRGIEDSPDLEGTPSGAAFLFAFTAFPYLAALWDESTIGAHVGWDEEGNHVIQMLAGGEPWEGVQMLAESGRSGFRFDLMPLYYAQSQALEHFIQRDFSGQFEAFFKTYLAEIDIDFSFDKAWRPLTSAA